MNPEEQLSIDQDRLVGAWQRTLPTILNGSDKAEVLADEADAQTLRIHIRVEGHTMYSFDFKCTYVDSREIRVELVDVERDGQTVDERGEIIQQLVQDYTRHIHECAQALHSVTKA